jgi:hypothetical protein
LADGILSQFACGLSQVEGKLFADQWLLRQSVNFGNASPPVASGTAVETGRSSEWTDLRLGDLHSDLLTDRSESSASWIEFQIRRLSKELKDERRLRILNTDDLRRKLHDEQEMKQELQRDIQSLRRALECPSAGAFMQQQHVDLCMTSEGLPEEEQEPGMANHAPSEWHTEYALHENGGSTPMQGTVPLASSPQKASLWRDRSVLQDFIRIRRGLDKARRASERRVADVDGSLGELSPLENASSCLIDGSTGAANAAQMRSRSRVEGESLFSGHESNFSAFRLAAAELERKSNRSGEQYRTRAGSSNKDRLKHPVRPIKWSSH